jgi:hypothetical protein
MDLCLIGRTVGWGTAAPQFLSSSEFSSAFSAQFHSVWTEQGHSIREQIGNDALLAELLWKVLPTYVGPATTLFRGENLERLRSGRVGFCWTMQVETARMFGRGLNAIHSGGVLLRSEVPTHAVIAGPSAHSEYLNEHEFTIDPRLIERVDVVERYPMCT